MVHFYNEWHLGDCIRQIHFQRHLPVPSMLWCNPEYLAELQPFTKFSLVQLGNISQMPEGLAINSWIGQDELHTKWGWEDDFAAFYLKFLEYLADKAHLTSPLTISKHLLLDGPAILMRKAPARPADVLFINSKPFSGQWDEDLAPLNQLVHLIRGPVMTTEVLPPGFRMFPVTSTRDHAPMLIDIARAAMDAKYVIGIDTGPMIPTFNVYSKARHIVLHNSVSYDGYPNTVTVKTYGALQRVLEEEKLLI